MNALRLRFRRRRGAGRPHVVIIVQNLPAIRDIRVRSEATTLREAGFRVSVISPKADGQRVYEELRGIRLLSYPRPRWTTGFLGLVWEALYSWMWISLLVARLLLREPIDFLQACNPPDTFFPLGVLVKASGGRFIFDQHDLSPELFAARFDRTDRVPVALLKVLEKATYRTADHVISVNESFKRLAIARGRKNPDSVTVVRNGPAVGALHSTKPSPELMEGRRYLCCCVGMMNPQDGVGFAIQSVAEYVYGLNRTDCLFAFLGDGDSLEQIKRTVHDLSLDEWVVFTGWASRELVWRYLSTADIGLSPEPRNAMNDLVTSIKVMEYMAAGLPIVAYDLRETRVSAGSAAAYAPPNDFRAFAECVSSLLDDPNRRQRMAAEGQHRIATGLSWEHQKVKYLSVFSSLEAAAEQSH